jgi:hypothetical protein
MDIYVVVTENNEEHATPSGRKYCDDRGPLVFEQYTRDADLKSIKERAEILEKMYGKCRIAKLQFIDDQVES